MKKAFRSFLSCFIIVGMVMTYFTPVRAIENKANTTVDMQTIKSRLKDYFLDLDTIDDGAKVETCYVSKAKDYLDSIKTDGSWDDVDYSSTVNASNGRPWDPYLAIDRMQALAIAYSKPDHELYQDAKVITALNNALLHWKKVNPKSDGWWQNDIGVQLRFSRIGLFLENILSSDAYDVILNKLQIDGVEGGTGQNNLWYDQNAMYRAILTNDADKLNQVLDDCFAYVLVLQTDNTTLEALQVDNSLYFHEEQFYSNGYGLSMFRDVSFWLYILRDTSFAMEQEIVNRMSDFMLDGTRWTIRGDIIELYLGYRPYKFDVGFTDYADEYIEPLKRMMVVDQSRKDEYQTLLDNIMGVRNDNGLNGNNYMWRVGYGSHMRDDYGVNIKMDSKRVIGGEWRGSWTGQNKGNLVYWTSSATSTITVDGDEYTSVYPTFDWAHCPGATTPNMLSTDFSNSGRFRNGTDHMIGVSNGKYGSDAYVMNKQNTQATKGYFFFDDEFVALGAGINSQNNTAIHTTINQSKANNVKVDGTAVPTGTKDKSYTGKWIHNDKIGYVFPNETTFKVSNGLQKDTPSLWNQAEIDATPETFTAWVDHGVKPTDDSYEYIVLPNKTEAEVDAYSKNIPVTIVSNTKDIQAVRHDGLKQTQINFYKAGTLEYAAGKTITVNQACSVIIDESGSKPVISLAMTDTDYEKAVEVNLNINGASSVTNFVVGRAPYTGQTITLTAGETNMYTASSAVDGHPAAHAYDGKMDTYWKSETGEDQWILNALEKNTFISTMTINWKDNYAKKYKIQISKDGVNYTDAKTVDNGNGGKEEIDIFDVVSHVRIVCLESSNGSGYEISEITYKGGTNISVNQKVTVSSVSAKDTGNIARYAVDGNSGTRWSSARNSNEEWILVDLGGKAKVNAVRILWEGAKSAEYTVDISADSKTWKTLKTVTDENTLLDQIVLDETAEGRYIRINSTKSKTSKYGISIFEFEVYGDVELEPEEELENIAIAKTATASSTNSTDEPRKAVDNNLGTFWKSDVQKEHYLRVALKDTYSISQVIVDWGRVFMDGYKIQVSMNGETWKTIETVEKCYGGREVLNLEDIADAKYIQIIGTTSEGKNVVINEFEVYGKLKEADERINIALNKPSEASSEYLDTKEGNKVYHSTLAFDGSVATVNGQQSRWVSNRESNDEWIQVDLADNYLLDSVVLNWEGNGAKDFKILVSTNGTDWSEAVHKTDGGKGVQEIPFNSLIEARYVKMQGITPGGKFGYSLWEFEVYGDLAKKSDDSNIALNKPSKASTEYTNPNSKFVLESKYAFDGSVEDRGAAFQSRWVSARRKDNPGVNVDSQWIQVDLVDVYAVDKVVLNWEGACGKDYKIQISDDGENWTDMTHVTDGKAGIIEFTYDKPMTGRYVRMLGILPAGEFGYSLWEFEVYGKNLKAELKEYYDDNRNIDVSPYTPKSVALYTEALDKIVAIYKDKDATANQIQKAKEGLEKAINGLTLKANKTDLENELKKAEAVDTDLYTPESVKAFDEAVKEANKVNSDENATQAQVKKVTEDLQKAIDGLIKKADKAVLRSEIKKAEAIDTKLYTKDTVKVLDEALKEADKVNKDENATQEEVNKATDKLQKAIQGLEKKGEIIITPDETEKQTIYSADKNVSVTAKLPKNIELLVKLYNQKQTQDLIAKVMNKNPDFFKGAKLEKVYDLSLLLNGKVYKANTELEISFKLDKALVNKNLGIVYIDDNGNVEKIESRVKDGYIYFKAKHLSQYAIVTYPQNSNNNNSSNGSETTVETGDQTQMPAYVMMLGASLCIAAYITFKKRKQVG